MKRISLLIGGVLFFVSCTYHGKIARHLYPILPNSSAIPVSVLLRTDTDFPKELFITESENNGTQAFILDLQEHMVAEIADALGTVFQTTDAGTLALQNQYDYVAVANLEAGLTRTTCAGELSKWAVRKEGLCILLRISFYKPYGAELLQTVQATRWREFRKPGFASSVRWLNQHTYIFSPILTPLYMQAQGHMLRKQFEDNWIEVLQDIVKQIEANRAVFIEKTSSLQDTAAQNYVK